MKKTVLFICTHNSARSQLAEGLVNHFFQDEWKAYSAGTVVTSVKVYAVRALAEIGIDILHHRSKSLTTFNNKKFNLVVTMCDRAKESCPYFQGIGPRFCPGPLIGIGCLGHRFPHVFINEKLYLTDTTGVTCLHTNREITKHQCIWRKWER